MPYLTLFIAKRIFFFHGVMSIRLAISRQKRHSYLKGRIMMNPPEGMRSNNSVVLLFPRLCL